MFLLLCLIIQVTAWEHPQPLLPAKVMAMKNSLMHELQSLQSLIPGKHRDDRGNDHHIQLMMDEFLVQNQESIELILRVLKLIDHDLENVIHDCERLFDLKALRSSNAIFGSVTKPLLLKVRDLCHSVANSRVDLIETGLVAVETEAYAYRGKLDQTVQDIAVVSSQLESGVFATHARERQESAMTLIKQVDEVILEEIDRNLTEYSLRWQQLMKNFIAIIPDNAAIDLEDHPEIGTLYDVFNSLDNETTVLQEDTKELMAMWVELIEDVVGELKNLTEESDDYIREYALECFFDNKIRLTDVANYYKKFNRIILQSLDKLYRCVDFEEEIGTSFRRMQPILSSTDKAIGYIMDTYTKCATMTDEIRSDFPFELCVEEASVLLTRTREFVESKVVEIYNHVVEAIELNEVTIGACLYNQLIDTFLLNGEHFENFENCNGSD